MTEPFEGAEEAPAADPRAGRPAPTTAGGLIRAARERQGMHIAALAAAIKVAPRKLDALEHDRYDELPDATFTRALAQTVCRTLKVPPQPVLALLPAAEASALDHVTGALNQPFRDRPSREDHSPLVVAAVRPMVWAGLALLVAALALYLVPVGVWQQWLATSAAGVATPSVPVTVAATSTVAPMWPPAGPPASAVAGTEQPASVPASAASVAPVAQVLSAASAADDAPMLQLRAESASWVDVRDGRGQPLLSRTVQRGETVAVDGALPLRLTIGNAPATRLNFRGRPVDLAPVTRDSVARLELQ